MKKLITSLVITAALLPTTTSLNAQEQQADTTNEHAANSSANSGVHYACKMNDLARRIEVDYPDSPAPLPCEVNYYKDVEAPGEQFRLWRAENNQGYCRFQAEGLVRKLTELGWDCERQ